TQAALSFIGRHDASLKHTRHTLPSSSFHPKGGETIVWTVSFVRPVENLPVSQLSAAAQRDRPCPQSSQRKCDHFKVSSAEDARELDSGRPARGPGGFLG